MGFKGIITQNDGGISENILEGALWLKIIPQAASRQIPIAYVNSKDWHGRGYIIMELMHGQSIVFDCDDGLFNKINIHDIYRLRVDHATISVFTLKCSLDGVRPRNSVMGEAICCSDEFFLRSWL